jgi:hypothetical protein
MGKTVQTFPSQSGGVAVSQLPPGCYTAMMTALFADDTYRVNDTATVSFTIAPIGAVEGTVFNAITLAQNYPNPATTSTAFAFTLSEPGYVTLSIADMMGRTYPLLTDTYFAEGSHSRSADLRDLANGLYVYELSFKDMTGRTQRLAKILNVME